jgi:hypothetical protein
LISSAPPAAIAAHGPVRSGQSDVSTTYIPGASEVRRLPASAAHSPRPSARRAATVIVRPIQADSSPAARARAQGLHGRNDTKIVRWRVCSLFARMPWCGPAVPGVLGRRRRG